jgi:hypothetical protein
MVSPIPGVAGQAITQQIDCGPDVYRFSRDCQHSLSKRLGIANPKPTTPRLQRGMRLLLKIIKVSQSHIERGTVGIKL